MSQSSHAACRLRVGRRVWVFLHDASAEKGVISGRTTPCSAGACWQWLCSPGVMGHPLSKVNELSEGRCHSCCPQPLHVTTFKALVYISYIYGVSKKT